MVVSVEQVADETIQLNEIDKIVSVAEDFEDEGSDVGLDSGVGVYEEPKMETSELCSTLLMLGFSLLESKRGAHWALSAAEAQVAGKAFGDVMDKYFPDMASKGVEVTAGLAALVLFAPRLKADSDNAEKPVFNMEGAVSGD